MNQQVFKKVAEAISHHTLSLDVDGCFDLIDQADVVKDAATKAYLKLLSKDRVGEIFCDLDFTSHQAFMLVAFEDPFKACGNYLNEIYLSVEAELREGLEQAVPAMLNEQSIGNYIDHQMGMLKGDAA